MPMLYAYRQFTESAILICLLAGPPLDTRWPDNDLAKIDRRKYSLQEQLAKLQLFRDETGCAQRATTLIKFSGLKGLPI